MTDRDVLLANAAQAIARGRGAATPVARSDKACRRLQRRPTAL